jgi:hypothetical protein
VRSFPLVSSPKPCIHLSSPLIRAAYPAHLILLDWITRKILDEEYRSLSSPFCSFSPLPCYLFPLTPRYSPQHPILKHSQPTFLPQSARPSFTPRHNDEKIYSSVYLNLYIFWIANSKTKGSAPNDSKHSMTSIYS